MTIASKQVVGGNSNDNSNIDIYFDLFDETIISIAKHYNQSIELETLNSKNFQYRDKNITDINFKNVSNKLEPDKKYLVKIFQIQSKVSSEQCLIFLRSQKCILVGPYGLSALYKKNKDLMQVNGWIISLDNKESLFKKIDGNYEVPYIYYLPDGQLRFSLVSFEGDWRAGHYLVGVCEYPGSFHSLFCS